MFNTQEYQYIKDLTINFYNQGYKNYLCYTNNVNNYSTSYYDVICYYSKNNLDLNSYTLSLHTDTIKCSFDSKSSTSSYKNNSSLNCGNNSDNSVNINAKEFIYSNVGNNSDLISEYTNNLRYQNNFSLFLTSILAMLVLLFLHRFTSRILRR
jgi:hypothetical protein